MTKKTNNNKSGRPPQLSEEQMRELLMVGREVLRGGRYELFSDEDGRMCKQPIERGDTDRIE